MFYSKPFHYGGQMLLLGTPKTPPWEVEERGHRLVEFSNCVNIVGGGDPL